MESKEVFLRKDKMSIYCLGKSKSTLHPDCFYKISNSNAHEPLNIDCDYCKKKYKEYATAKMPYGTPNVRIVPLCEPRPAKESDKVFLYRGEKMGYKKFLYFRNIELERKNAVLEHENKQLKERLGIK